ncbi:FAD/NAD(P)-binding protein [bacterium]|nr:FAD/NAD(P)-binding protein [bacterium]MBU1754347.1 FAD/NAD(P)-binding protein [bacterium]
MSNIYSPNIARVMEVRDETPDVRSFRFEFIDPEIHKNFTWKAGQFLILSVFGVGEAVFTFANPQTRKQFVECSIRKVGLVTEAIHELEVGDTVGIRGPYGNWFPFEEFKGRNLLFVAGGIGLAALRSPIEYSLDTREDYGKITILYGARSPLDICYKDKLTEWQNSDSVELVLTVDRGNDEWKHRVGLIPNILKEMNPDAENTIAIICGPPIMIKFTLKALADMGFTDNQIVTTLEMKMKCGLGKCGRCNIENIFVCKDGPVFYYTQLKNLPEEY